MLKTEAYEKPLVEKYRPTRLDEVVGNSTAVDQLKAIAEEGGMPNIILVVSQIFKNELPVFLLIYDIGSSRYWKDILGYVPS